MTKFRALLKRITALFHRDHRDADLAAELESHLQFHIEDNLRAGMSAEEARRQALIKLGGLDQTKESVRARRGLPRLDSLLQDTRFALRMLRKNPGFTTVAILTLALGIGVNAGIFSILDALTLRPITANAREPLVSVYPILLGRVHRNVLNSINLFSYPEYRELHDRNHVFSALTAY